MFLALGERFQRTHLRLRYPQWLSGSCCHLYSCEEVAMEMWPRDHCGPSYRFTKSETSWMLEPLSGVFVWVIKDVPVESQSLVSKNMYVKVHMRCYGVCVWLVSPGCIHSFPPYVLETGSCRPLWHLIQSGGDNGWMGSSSFKKYTRLTVLKSQPKKRGAIYQLHPQSKLSSEH